MTTLLPYRSAAGPLLLGARAAGTGRVELACTVARPIPAGRWRHVADLLVCEEEVPDGDRISFDPVRHRLPGLEQYRWVERLREPAYAEARRSRGAAPP